MAPKPPISAKLTLSYPLYAVDFDPKQPDRLVVGGGGGAGRSGVGNKITVLDATNATELVETAEIDLSKDEDSVTSLAVGPTKGKATLIYAGVNSSAKDIAEGNNQHFRTFGLQTAAATKKATAKSTVSELSRSKLFIGSESDAYQRVLRLSRPFPNCPQLGAAATGAGLSSKQTEIVLFDTAAAATETPNIRGRVQLDVEAKDVDVIQSGKDEYIFAYCTEYEVYVKKISSKTPATAPANVYIVPDSQKSTTEPTFRSLRFLTPDFLVMLTNIHGRKGVTVQVLRLPPGLEGKCSFAQSVHLPSHVKMATGLSLVNLSPPTSPGEPQAEGQFIIAVAGIDISITLFTCVLQRSASVQLVADLKVLQTLKDVHPLQITGIAFSGFAPPKENIQPQPLRLASISMGNTVVVHTIPLLKHSHEGKTQYVASIPSVANPPVGLILLIIFTIFTAFIVQLTLEIRGVSPNFTHVKEKDLQYDVVALMRAPQLNAILGTPRITSTSSFIPVPTTSPQTSSGSLADVIDSLHIERAESAETNPSAAPVIILRSGSDATNPDLTEDVKAHLHDEAVDGPHGGKTWEELSDKEKETWTNKLKSAGHWVEDYAETVLKGVLFGAIGAEL